MRSVLIAFVVLFVALCGVVSAQNSSACGVCHANHMKSWSDSPHAVSWSDSEFQAQLTKFGTEEVCAKCHAPLSVWKQVDKRQDVSKADSLTQTIRDTKVEYEPELAALPVGRGNEHEDGVNCGACHLVQVFTGVSKSEDFIGPYQTVEGHGGREAGVFKSHQICGSCHGRAAEEHLPEGTKAQEGFHHAASQAVSFEVDAVDCSQCHMGRASGKLVQLSSFRNVEKREIGAHSFTGKRYDQLADHLRVEVDPALGKVVLANEGIGHPLKICTETNYRLAVTVMSGNEKVDSRSIDLEGVEALSRGSEMAFELPGGALKDGKVSVALFVTGISGTEKKAFERVI